MATSMRSESRSNTTGRQFWPTSLRVSLPNRSQRVDPAPTSTRPLPSVDQMPNVDHENNVPSSKASVIHIICDQISQGLCDVSESLNNEMLQELSVEIAKYSEDAIKRKIIVQSNDDNKSTGSLQKAINERMANVVEKVEKSPAHLHPIPEVEQFLSKNNRQYDVFLNICDPDLMTDPHQLRHDYIAFKRSDINVPLMAFALVCGVFSVSTGLSWSSDMSTFLRYPILLPSMISAVFTAISGGFVALNRLAFLSFRYNIVCLQWYHKHVTKLYDSSYGQWPENITVVFVALSTGSYLVNLAMMDVCDPEKIVNVGRRNQPSCDSSVGLPTEWYVFVMIVLIIVQILLRGVSRIALVSSWIICLVAINTTIYLSDSGNYVWMNVLQVLIICVSYELERQPLRQFLKTLKTIEAGELAAQLRVRLAAYETVQAAEALKAKCSLVRHIGHEIRTPLNVVGVGVDMLMKELEPHAAILPDNVMEILNDIKEASSASLEVVNELLMFEKLAAGMTTLECVPTLVLPFLEQAMRQHMLPARAKNILFELVQSSVSSDVAVDVDPVKLITVFRNLFSNAIKFTKLQGRVTVRAEIKSSSCEEEEVVEVTVQDTGAGLSPANLRKLFGEGVQFNANGLQGGGGSGLGLFITKGIVELHKHGKIWAESEGEGFGCTFFVQLPLYSRHYVPPAADITTDVSPLSRTEHLHSRIRTSEQPDEKQPESHEGCRPVISPLRAPARPQLPAVAVIGTWKPTILVVDDSAMNRKMLVRMLISKGFACCEAEDGVEALSEMSRMCLHKVNSGSDMSRTPSRLLPCLGASRASSALFPQRQSSPPPVHFEQQQFTIDAVLIDSNMPRMNGPEAIVEMRKIGFRGPIIGVSGGDEITMKQFFDAGADNVMQKPAQSDKLVTMLLTGLQLVVQDATSRHLGQSLMNGNVRSSVNARQEHIYRLCRFLDEANTVGKK